jgi:hypothetical protein
VLGKNKYGFGLPKIDGSVDHPDIWWKDRDVSRRCFGSNVGCYSLLVFGRNVSSGTALMNIGGLVAFLGMRLVAGFLFSWPLPMAARRLKWLLIGVILIFTITLCPLFLLLLLLLLLLYFFFTSLGIRGRRITPSWPRAALRTLLAQHLLHGPQGGGDVPSLGPPLSGGLLGLASDLHSHHLDR